jgi:formate dehydrogenase iron-sulfur subunit
MAEKAILVDTTKCMGCRGCQVACKQWNELPAEATTFFGGPGYQNPADVSVNTFTVVEFHAAPGGKDLDAEGNWNFLKFQCMHCKVPLCKMACDGLYNPATPNKFAAIKVSPEGFVYVDLSRCKAKLAPKGCAGAYGPRCVAACPYGVPKVGQVDMGGYFKKVMRKCRGCFDREEYGLEPACVKSCPTDALQYGERSAIIATAVARAADAAVLAKYPNANVYGATGLYGGGHVIYVLAQPPGFYGLP